ncbi:hypothetical protein [Clostridium sp. C8-1-8]|uniref:hypothetical protein n=1 Tax=Clostridium sp. C8-1-8 TaxID=2698831 RepID=UPI001368544D|nr:hypothetical protein [Clostridium sp. C8-1-8]
MKWTYFGERLGIALLIPALIGLFFSKILVGAVMLGVSSALSMIILNIVGFAKKEVDVKIFILGDITTLLLVAMLLSIYYFKREDITTYIVISILAFIAIFSIINAIQKRRNS